MIYGIGVDLVRVDRLARAVARYGERFLNRVFTDREIAYCQTRSKQGVYQFAQRFAAKEGKPEIRVTGRAASLCREHGIKGMHLSLTDEDNLAVAMVVLET